MSSTPATSEAKLTCSRKKSTGSNDFWDFYLSDMDFVDCIFKAQSSRYQTKYDLDDLRQEVYIRLQTNRVMEQYDPAKSKINTFLTNKIRGYLQHVIRNGIPKWNPSPTTRMDPVQDYKQQMFSNLNGIPEQEGYLHYEEEIGDSGDPLDDIEFQLKMEKLSLILGKDKMEFLQRIADGWKFRDIAKYMGVSENCVTQTFMQKIKDKKDVIARVWGRA